MYGILQGRHTAIIISCRIFLKIKIASIQIHTNKTFCVNDKSYLIFPVIHGIAPHYRCYSKIY